MVRAERLRRTAVNELTLDRASYTTCDFGEPHYHFQCREFVLDEYDDHTSFTAYRNVLWWDPVPILYLPIIAGRSDFSTRPLRAVNAGRSSRFGTVVETLWGDDIQAGGERWGEWRLHADVRTRRGLGGGVDVDYRTADYEGRVTGYYQRDRADRDGFDDSPVPRTGRWQGKFEHRQRLGEDLRLDLSFRDFSDRNYQPEYFRKDALEEREPETYAHLRWAHGTDLAALTGEVRTAPFLTQTERLPGAEVHRVGGGVPLGPLRGVLDSLTYSVDAEGGRLDRLYDQRLGPTGERVWRVDAAARLEGSAGLGPVRIVPFLAAGRTGWQADSLPDGSDAADRLDFAGGVRAAIEARRDFPAASSDLFGFRGMRHVVGLDALYFNRWSVDRAPGDLVPLDSLESLERVEVVGARLRNRLQVVRGGRRVDWIDLEVRGLYFPDGLRGRAPIPGFREEGVEGPRFQDFTGEEKYRAAPLRGRWGPWEGDLRVMLRENLFLAGEGEYDPYDGALRTSLLGVRWFVLPKASIYAGDRRIRGDSDIYTLKADWSVSDRWALGVTQQADLRSGKGMLSEIAVRRLLHDFVIEFSFRDERTSHDRSFRVSIIPTSLWVAPTSLEKVGSLDYDAKRWYR